MMKNNSNWNIPSNWTSQEMDDKSFQNKLY